MEGASQRKCEARSAGAVIRKGNKILLIDRSFFPLGWACPAGHVKKGEKPADGMRREIKEETGLAVVAPRLLISRKHIKNKCVKGSAFHDWWVFECRARGKLKIAKREGKDIGWFSPEEIKTLELEPIWRLWFRRLKII
ncbi:MAG: hypothetical protein A2667_02725 [Candidatus Wildermuthbacteria bacterium RIFCSPHIGHO2_01_FULL_47_27]|uniref:Nudix hydrolase domain-containing protein n=1 Tax=Candidatus Wildermuthbacteria bacterium RIFCSPLOWO2_01_FULL_48_35 TaxID=1802463 RepID=A0A1G2RT69_9BACT|nr:MAG: hypothetical protein A2667_02725 [Candidatus Wildermuthbacteria bacterium RIFCSPHIGHO2_01_FULL_47_27]OHA75658.1 MAG: hypothetical protein A3A32_03845 [Candidatus Wildermuthbacteria bacterium RIFCSPLOWO2_01_FULL_48_35]